MRTGSTGARLGPPTRLTWQLGRVLELIDETPRCTSIVLELPEWPGHRAGQHVDVRLTAEDGYQTERSYSIASSPGDRELVLTVERLDDGEVSPYLTEELRPGDELELRGPIGGYFVWEPSLGGPLLMVAGGSGVVPFRAMLRDRAASGCEVRARLLYSSRSLDEVIYRDELTRFGAEDQTDVHVTLTRDWPEQWQGHRGRIDRRFLDETAWPAAEEPLVYVCGPSGFVEAVAEAFVGSGHHPDRIRTERFGPTGS
jgi:ferredoxin-NADP reductase